MPGFCIDISSVIDTKAAMLTAHTSQREWLLRHHGMDQYVESMRAWMNAGDSYVPAVEIAATTWSKIHQLRRRRFLHPRS